MSKENTLLSKEYTQTLAEIKQAVRAAQTKAMLSVNKELLKLYWFIGQTIVSRQQSSGWGSKVIEHLSQDIQNAFPGIGGFSKLNISRMRSFYLAYEIVSQAVTQLEELPIFNIPWGHNIVLMHKLVDNRERLWYAQKATELGWSRSILEMQIQSNLYQRQGKAITNFSRTLPEPSSDMAQQSLKDPYIFDFLTLRDEYNERDVEHGLVEHIQKFLLELGQGFAFVGRQYHLAVGDQDFYIDLLFYHLKLRCFIVIELKNTAFVPEYAGKLNFYLSAVDDVLRSAGDRPTIGLLLCKSKNNYIAEYALRNITSPIGVASYETKLVESLPKDLKGSLPSIEEIEAEIAKIDLKY